MLHTITREQLEKFKDKYGQEMLGETLGHDMVHQRDIPKFIISSHIALLHAELERKKGMLKEIPAPLSIDRSNVLSYAVASNNWQNEYESTEGYNEAITEDITYLEEEIKKIQEL